MRQIPQTNGQPEAQNPASDAKEASSFAALAAPAGIPVHCVHCTLSISHAL